MAEVVQDFDGRPVRVDRRFHHEQRYGPDGYRLGHAVVAVACDVTRSLASPGRVADVDSVPQAEAFHDDCSVGGVVAHVVPVAHLGRTPVPARRAPRTTMRNTDMTDLMKAVVLARFGGADAFELRDVLVPQVEPRQ